jgi:peptide/nickel transport system permease protein
MSAEFVIGIVLAVLIGGVSVVSLFYTPYGWDRMNSAQRFVAPCAAHLLGTDNFGRDILSRIMVGAKYTLFVSLVTVLGSAAIGSALGMFSGWIGGPLDELVMRSMDAVGSFPGILLALVMIAVLGEGQASLIIALLVLFIPSYVRIMRSGALEYKHRDFVSAAIIQGASPLRILFLHIVPNLGPSLISASVLGLSNAILAEAAMSYLGLGIQPPIPSWGRMLSESQNFLLNAPWCALAPGFFIMLTVIAFHFIGEGIRKRYC